MRLSEEELCALGMDVVEIQAQRLKRRIGDRADLDELRGDGMLGLLKAARSYREAWATYPFEPWASTIIRNTMIDGLRKTHGREFKKMNTVSLDAEILSDDGSATYLDMLEDTRANTEETVLFREKVSEGPPKKPRFIRQKAKGRLGPKELETVYQAAQGLTVDESAAARHISPDTVRAQRSVAISKLGARNMASAVAQAFRKGLIK